MCCRALLSMACMQVLRNGHRCSQVEQQQRVRRAGISRTPKCKKQAPASRGRQGSTYVLYSSVPYSSAPRLAIKEGAKQRRIWLNLITSLTLHPPSLSSVPHNCGTDDISPPQPPPRPGVSRDSFSTRGLYRATSQTDETPAWTRSDL